MVLKGLLTLPRTNSNVNLGPEATLTSHMLLHLMRLYYKNHDDNLRINAFRISALGNWFNGKGISLYTCILQPSALAVVAALLQIPAACWCALQEAVADGSSSWVLVTHTTKSDLADKDFITAQLWLLWAF